MLRAVLLTGAFLFCALAYAEPQEPPDPERLAVLEVEYRCAKARGEKEKCYEILREAAKAAPKRKCSEWYLKLAEELLAAGRIKEARHEFDRVLALEPEFTEAAVGIARTYALEKADRAAKVEMLRAAGRGYTVSLMMRKKELCKYFKEHEFVLRLLEADMPRLTTDRDPFKNPLRKKVKPDGPVDPEPKKEPLAPEVQEQIVLSAKAALKRGQVALAREEIDAAIVDYNKIQKYYKMKEFFTEEKRIKKLEKVRELAKKKLYPKIQAALRERTLREARELVRKLTVAVSKRELKEARRLNAVFLKLVDTADTKNDQELKTRLARIDADRAEQYRIVEVFEDFDKNVRPRLLVSGTITGRLTRGRAVAFFEVSTEEGVRKLAVSTSDSVDLLGEFRVTRIDEDEITAKYRDVEVKIGVGRDRRQAGIAQP